MPKENQRKYLVGNGQDGYNFIVFRVCQFDKAENKLENDDGRAHCLLFTWKEARALRKTLPHLSIFRVVKVGK